MYAPVGAPNTWPVPESSMRGSDIGPKTVSLVPSEIASRPSATRPAPMRLLGLSPVQAITAAGAKPYRICQYGASAPTLLQGSAIVGSLRASLGAVASTAGGHQLRAVRSM